QQKFGAYNSYWKRTLRQIENGTYLRNLSKIGREAVRTGAEIPEEILAAMPKRMREQVVRDREQAIAIAKRRKAEADGGEAAPAPPPRTRPARITEQRISAPPTKPPLAPSQVTRPNPIAPGAAAARGPVEVKETAAPGTSGSLPRAAKPPAETQAIPRIPKPPP